MSDATKSTGTSGADCSESNSKQAIGFADGLIMARKLVDRLEAENLELRKERDDLLRIDNERLVSVAVADTEEKQ